MNNRKTDNNRKQDSVKSERTKKVKNSPEIQDATQQMFDMTKMIRKEMKEAEDLFDSRERDIQRKATRNIDIFDGSASRRVVEIASDMRRASDELFASYQSLIGMIDSKCRPLLEYSPSLDAIQSVCEVIQLLNKESEIEVNTTASFEGVGLGDVVNVRYVPLMENKMIQKFWEMQLKENPEFKQKEIIKKQQEEERKNEARKRAEERKKREESKAKKKAQQKKERDEKIDKLKKERIEIEEKELEQEILAWTEETESIKKQKEAEKTRCEEEIYSVTEENKSRIRRESQDKEKKINDGISALVNEKERLLQELNSLSFLELIKKSNIKKSINNIESEIIEKKTELEEIASWYDSCIDRIDKEHDSKLNALGYELDKKYIIPIHPKKKREMDIEKKKRVRMEAEIQQKKEAVERYNARLKQKKQNMTDVKLKTYELKEKTLKIMRKMDHRDIRRSEVLERFGEDLTVQRLVVVMNELEKEGKLSKYERNRIAYYNVCPVWNCEYCTEELISSNCWRLKDNDNKQICLCETCVREILQNKLLVYLDDIGMDINEYSLGKYKQVSNISTNNLIDLITESNDMGITVIGPEKNDD